MRGWLITKNTKVFNAESRADLQFGIINIAMNIHASRSTPIRSKEVSLKTGTCRNTAVITAETTASRIIAIQPSSSPP